MSSGLYGFFFNDKYILLLNDHPKNSALPLHEEAKTLIMGDVANKTKYELNAIVVDLSDGSFKRHTIPYNSSMPPFLTKALKFGNEIILPSYVPGSMMSKSEYQVGRITIK